MYFQKLYTVVLTVALTYTSNHAAWSAHDPQFSISSTHVPSYHCVGSSHTEGIEIYQDDDNCWKASILEEENIPVFFAPNWDITRFKALSEDKKKFAIHLVGTNNIEQPYLFWIGKGCLGGGGNRPSAPSNSDDDSLSSDTDASNDADSSSSHKNDEQDISRFRVNLDLDINEMRELVAPDENTWESVISSSKVCDYSTNSFNNSDSSSKELSSPSNSPRNLSWNSHHTKETKYKSTKKEKKIKVKKKKKPSHSSLSHTSFLPKDSLPQHPFPLKSFQKHNLYNHHTKATKYKSTKKEKKIKATKKKKPSRSSFSHTSFSPKDSSPQHPFPLKSFQTYNLYNHHTKATKYEPRNKKQQEPAFPPLHTKPSKKVPSLKCSLPTQEELEARFASREKAMKKDPLDGLSAQFGPSKFEQKSLELKKNSIIATQQGKSILEKIEQDGLANHQEEAIEILKVLEKSRDNLNNHQRLVTLLNSNHECPSANCDLAATRAKQYKTIKELRDLVNPGDSPPLVKREAHFSLGAVNQVTGVNAMNSLFEAVEKDKKKRAQDEEDSSSEDDETKYYALNTTERRNQDAEEAGAVMVDILIILASLKTLVSEAARHGYKEYEKIARKQSKIIPPKQLKVSQKKIASTKTFAPKNRKISNVKPKKTKLSSNTRRSLKHQNHPSTHPKQPKAKGNHKAKPHPISKVKQNNAQNNPPSITKQKKSTQRPTKPQYKVKKPGLSGKEGAKDVPDWVKYSGKRPKVNESGKAFAKRVMDERWGKNSWKSDLERQKDFSKIKKWVDRSFENPKKVQ